MEFFGGVKNTRKRAGIVLSSRARDRNRIFSGLPEGKHRFGTKLGGMQERIAQGPLNRPGPSLQFGLHLFWNTTRTNIIYSMDP
jgi:hypothetical protein